jgi:hypothetical protein
MTGPSALNAPEPPTAAEGAASDKKYGIAVLANDKVIDWLLPFLESYLQTNADIPLYLIPYNENCEKTRRIAKLYGVTFVEIDSKALDALSKKLYPLSLGKRSRLRKFLCLALPLDEVIYLDVDIVLFRDLRPLLGRLRPGETDFIVVSRTTEYVYNERHRDYDYLRNAFLFNDGFFITSNKILSVQDFYDAMEADESIFDAVRQRGGLYAQPLCNFVVHRKRLKIVAVPDLIPGASNESYHKAQGVTFDPKGAPKDAFGGEIYFAHWAGVTYTPTKGAFDPTWKVLSDRAKARVAAAGL